jgi:polyisoprenoid-binding protein YceI
MIKTFITFLAFFYLTCVCGQDKSSVEFIIKNVGINVDGHFNNFQIKAAFNSSNTLTSVNGEIEVASLETGIESRDEHLLKEDYFDSEDYPKISLRSYKITKNSITDYTVKAKLSIKKTTKEITIPISVEILNKQWKVQSNFEINRKDFDVGGGSFVLGKTVKVKVLHYQPIE